MRSYAYTVVMLLNFLRARGLDLRSATESDIREFRLWRRGEADETVGEATWDRDSAAIGGLYDFLVEDGYVEARPWRATRRTAFDHREAGQEVPAVAQPGRKHRVVHRPLGRADRPPGPRPRANAHRATPR
ncbi:site-specific integrase [Streptomyces sp. NPDC056231]|uniref:site-specific integrase n=1 Tax=Streptomyces sp. NPDC056231 TaxID=3345755 RepID=UPI003AB03F74